MPPSSLFAPSCDIACLVSTACLCSAHAHAPLTTMMAGAGACWLCPLATTPALLNRVAWLRLGVPRGRSPSISPSHHVHSCSIDLQHHCRSMKNSEAAATTTTISSKSRRVRKRGRIFLAPPSPLPKRTFFFDRWIGRKSSLPPVAGTFQIFTKTYSYLHHHLCGHVLFSLARQ